jgi:hypothetical protein
MKPWWRVSKQASSQTHTHMHTENSRTNNKCTKTPQLCLLCQHKPLQLLVLLHPPTCPWHTHSYGSRHFASPLLECARMFRPSTQLILNQLPLTLHNFWSVIFHARTNYSELVTPYLEMSLLKYGLPKWKLPELGNLTGYALDDWGGGGGAFGTCSSVKNLTIILILLPLVYTSWSIFRLCCRCFWLTTWHLVPSWRSAYIKRTAHTLHIIQLQNGEVADVSETQCIELSSLELLHALPTSSV